MCNYCNDYIWVPHLGGMKCESCNACFHHSCAEVVNNNNTSMCRGESDTKVDSSSSPKSVTDWTIHNVIEWLATVNLYRYCDLFRRHNVVGSKLLTINEDELKSMKIEDEFHRKAMMVCIDELVGRQQTDDLSLDDSEECTSDVSEHNLNEHTFSSLQRCHKCNKYLYGIIRQGLLCSVCGLCIHKQCTSGKIPACGDDRLSRRRRSSFVHVPLFGVDLKSQIQSSRNGTVPDLLDICTTEIEQRIADGKQWNEAYRSPAAPAGDEISKLKLRFEEAADAFTVNIRDEKLSVIGGVVKKYLRELDDPLIPIAFYDRFIDAARIPEDDVRSRMIISLYNELPEHHNRTLQYMMSHFCRIIHNQNEANRLSPVFSHIILRPDWSKIMSLAYNTEYHVRIFNILYTNQSNQKEPDPLYNQMNCPPEPLPTPEPSDPKNIEQYDWFWGDITREEVHEKMIGTQDGTYLVRIARSHATNGDYTLTLRKGGMNRLIKICHRNGKYGFSEPYEFDSVPDLIRYFSAKSLAEYNSDLDIKLKYPILRPGNQYDSDDDSVILRKLLETHQEYQVKMEAYERLLESQIKTTQDVQNLFQASDSFKELVKVFEEQLELHARNQQANRAAHDYARMQENYTLLESRLNDIRVSKQRLDKSIDAKTEENKRLIIDISNEKPAIKALDRKREQFVKALMNKGYSKKKIDQALEQGENGYTLYEEENTVHKNRATWLSQNMTRKQAEECLTKIRIDETFLIRPGRESPFVLSIWLNNSVHHCKINQGAGGYGFEDPFIIFPDLTHMVLHYRENSLEEHNPILRACLRFPAFAGS